MRVIKGAAVLCLLLFDVATLSAQINIANLFETQVGKLPDESADFFPSLYDRTEIDYRKKGFSASTTLEQYHTTMEGRGYFDLSQLTFGYKKKRWEFKLGNFYETLGRGLLLRSFEIPGALLEDIGFRSRNYFHRDLLGGSVQYQSKKVTFKALRADVLNNLLPPTFDRAERRTDLITALESKVKYAKGHEVGFIVMNREEPDGTNQNFVSGLVNGTITNGLDYYGEYASSTESGIYALYTSLSGFSGAFSFVIEYKKYKNFVLGSGINEPPAGVKEQTYRVLNRSIHVSNPVNEEGYQIDLFYNFSDGTIINFNHSLARNVFGNRATTFRQFFLEVQSAIGENFEYKGFLDVSQDPFKGEDNRFSVGLYSDIGLNDRIRILPEFEFQSFTRGDQSIYNFNALVGLNVGAEIFVSVLGEITDDPFIIREGSSTRLYLGSTIRYKPSYRHSFQLFFGERRGGPQCTAGICYEILDFKGAEVRWVSKFTVK